MYLYTYIEKGRYILDMSNKEFYEFLIRCEDQLMENDKSDEGFDIGCDLTNKNEVRDRILVKLVRDGNGEAFNMIAARKSNYINKVIKNDYELMAYTKRGLDHEDLLQTGLIGLVNAVRKFDFRRGIKFDTYLAYNVKYSIKNEYREYGGVSISREANSIYSKCSKYLNSYDEKLTDELLEKLSDKLCLSKDKISKSIWAVKTRNAMYTYNSDGDIEGDEYAVDRYRRKIVDAYEEKFEKIMLHKEILNQLDKLTPKERYVLENIYIKDRTQVSIAEELGCSNTAVGKIKKSAVKKIRKNLGISEDE